MAAKIQMSPMKMRIENATYHFGNITLVTHLNKFTFTYHSYQFIVLILHQLHHKMFWISNK